MSNQAELLREAVELLRALADHNVTYWSDDGEARFNPGKNQADSMRIFREARDFLAKIDAAEAGGSEVVAYRIHWPQPEPLKTTYEVTDDGKRYEEVKALNHCRIDWLGVVGGIDRALAASGRQDGAR